MANKTQIVNATINPETNTCYVTYSTGTEKVYQADKLPKTVTAWLAAAAVELEEKADPKTAEETACSETTEEITEETTEEATEESSAPIDESFGNPEPLTENDSLRYQNGSRDQDKETGKTAQTQNKARTATFKGKPVKLSKEDLKRFGGALWTAGKKAYKAAAPKVIHGTGLIIAALTLALADLVKFLLPILADIAIAGAGWTFGLLSDTLPEWMSETVKPKAIHAGKGVIKAGKEAIKAAVIIYFMANIAIS